MDILRHLVLENPLTLCIVLGLIAVAAGLFWSRTGSPRSLAAVVASGGAAVLLVIISWAVETDQERVFRSLRRMTDAADDGNADAFIERISPEYGDSASARESVEAVVRLGLAHLRADTETPVVRMGEGQATVTQVYRLRPAPGSRVALPPPYQRVTWEGTFAPDGDGEWRLRTAVALKPERMTPEEASRQLHRALPRP
ncbi:MAG: hypothetical protein FJ288_06345 [Planctomycetes bacterium]|nr:hypothetical protein [Planctomycetota bacterium]